MPWARDDESSVLFKRLDHLRGATKLMPANVEVTGAARLYRAVSGGPPGWGSVPSIALQGAFACCSNSPSRFSMFAVVMRSLG
jgi:hypothetical protein